MRHIYNNNVWYYASQVIAFFDMDEDCSLAVRFVSFELPPVRKIIISNGHPEDLYPKDEPGAIARRFKIVHITEPTWIGARPATNTPQDTPLTYAMTQGGAPARTPLAPLPMQAI